MLSYIATIGYRVCELFNAEKYKGLRVIPYKYIERVKWELLKFIK